MRCCRYNIFRGALELCGATGVELPADKPDGEVVHSDEEQSIDLPAASQRPQRPSRGQQQPTDEETASAMDADIKPLNDGDMEAVDI
jgi:hypothetical protein